MSVPADVWSGEINKDSCRHEKWRQVNRMGKTAKTAGNAADCSINNIYRLEGRVPIGKAIPFGLQHILAMFVSNLAPITIIAGASKTPLTPAQLGMLLQNAMFVAGIATMIQLYPIWRIGSKLPVVMGVSFTFVTVLSTISANYGYPAVVGAVLVGGLFEGTLGLMENTGEDHYSDRSGLCSNSHRFFTFYSRSQIFWRRL